MVVSPRSGLRGIEHPPESLCERVVSLQQSPLIRMKVEERRVVSVVPYVNVARCGGRCRDILVVIHVGIQKEQASCRRELVDYEKY